MNRKEAIAKLVKQYIQIQSIEGAIVTGKQIGRASCRERVSSPV